MDPGSTRRMRVPRVARRHIVRNEEQQDLLLPHYKTYLQEQHQQSAAAATDGMGRGRRMELGPELEMNLGMWTSSMSALMYAQQQHLESTYLQLEEFLRRSPYLSTQVCHSSLPPPLPAVEADQVAQVAEAEQVDDDDNVKVKPLVKRKKYRAKVLRDKPPKKQAAAAQPHQNQQTHNSSSTRKGRDRKRKQVDKIQVKSQQTKRKRTKRVGKEGAKKNSKQKQQEMADATIEMLIQEMDWMQIDENNLQIVTCSQVGDIVLHAPSQSKPAKLKAKVCLDGESLRVWTMLKNDIDEDEETSQQWYETRLHMEFKILNFIRRLHSVQGNRRFTKWKGSVLDSVIGTFLTQNVSDHLSSSSFMHVTSNFPAVWSCLCPNCEVDQEEQEQELRSNRVRRALFVDDVAVQTSSMQLQQQVVEEEACIVDQISSQVDEQVIKCLPNNLQENEALDGGKKTKNAKFRMVTGIDRARLEHREGSTKKSYDWDGYKSKVKYERHSKHREDWTQDSVNWEAVRVADVKNIADIIKERGMNNILAGRIKALLQRIYEEHGTTDLEWVRDLSPKDAKQFLLSIRGLGIKSVECIRLLTLGHAAFPVDTNVGRICVRLGWVPIEPLPEEAQLHLLDLYPVQESIQKYLWPRLCKLDPTTLYELHYQMITFGKVFCTKYKPNCGACPMRSECKHYASSVASSNLTLPAPGDENINAHSELSLVATQTPSTIVPLQIGSEVQQQCEPIIEEPKTPDHDAWGNNDCPDIEDYPYKFEDIMHLNLVKSASSSNILNIGDEVASRELMLLPPHVAQKPAPKLKSTRGLRTVHYVYELPDDHSLLQDCQMDSREDGDGFKYSLLIWGEEEENEQNGNQQKSSSTIRGTLLIPCRTALRGRFPLNGTYFQTNEVFADYETSEHPLNVPRSLLWNMRRTYVYFGTSVTAIFKGLTIDEIRSCFCQGYVCVRAFDRRSKAPKSLLKRFHLPPSQVKGKNKVQKPSEV